MASICAICKSQFSKVMPDYGFDMDSVVSLHQLVSNAIVLDGQAEAAAGVEEEAEETAAAGQAGA
jgi:division protein CdvB (Snf7/Vps24/ESCRT-III family)